MKESTEYSAKIYEHGDYLITVVTRFNRESEAWLSHRDYGEALFMFGTETSIEEFEKLVAENLDEYIEQYKEVFDHERA